MGQEVGASNLPYRCLSECSVSTDGLDTLAEAKIASRKRLDADLARRAAQVIEATIDPERFPWLFETPPRVPTLTEREIAIRWTAGLQTVQEVQTRPGRRVRSAVSRATLPG